MNWYAYCSGNPIMFVDPTGLIGILSDNSIYMDEEDTWIDRQLIQYKIEYAAAGDNIEKRNAIAEKAAQLRKNHSGGYKVLAEHSIDMYYIPDITENLDNFMKTHESTFREHEDDLIWFANNVKTGALVDVKSYHSDFIRPKESYHVIYNGKVLRGDAPGNIAFGYLGTALGLEEFTLVGGAGIYQIYSDYGLNPIEYRRIFKDYGDNPGDGDQIKIGISAYWTKVGREQYRIPDYQYPNPLPSRPGY